MKISPAISSILLKTPEPIKKASDTKPENVVEVEQNSEVKLPLGEAASNASIHYWTKADRLFGLYSKYPEVKVMDLLSENEILPDDVLKFLLEVTKNEDTAERFIDEIIKDDNGNFDPKKSQDVVKKLVDALDGKENFEKWYYDKNGYIRAFSRYTKNYIENAQTVEDLYALSPAWGVWEVRNKFRNLTENKGVSIIEAKQVNKHYTEEVYTDGFTIGELPKEFKDKENYREFIEELRFNAQRGININETAKKFGFESIKIMDRGYSGKFNVNVDDKYVIKMSNFRDRHVSAGYYNELVDMTPDSVFLNSMVDYYTNRYAEGNSSNMYFYDDLTSSAVYEFEKGETVHFETDEAEINTRNEYFKNLFQEVEKIGVTYTDYNGNNYIQTENGVKCIDSGHAVYCDLLKPQVGGKMISLPCRTGLNPLELEGKLSSIID